MDQLGAWPTAEGRTRFRVWAPDRRSVAVAVESGGRVHHHPLERGADSSFRGMLPVGAGTRYRYCLDDNDCFPDPCSRFQPDGPHGPSEVVDPAAFRWSDGAWRGLSQKGQVLYELHVGTFSPEGTYDGVRTRLPHLRDLGVTCLELMPLNTFPGRFNWGYDGVSLFAPNPTYGRPDDLRRLVDDAHRLGLGVIVDVVYNHLGPDGNYLAQYAKAYFTDRYKNDWGQPLNFDGAEGRPVRDFFLANARMWIREYHLDGLRLDATQDLHDASPEHLVAELTRTVRAAVPDRSLLFVSENEPQDVQCITPVERGGRGGDLLWVDDFHHSARVALTGNSEAYCCDYRGTAQELLSCVLRNSLYQGQHYAWQKKARGTPLHRVPAHQPVFYLQNHDQLANTLRGLRLHTVAGIDRARAMTALLLLSPQTPMLFMGQEFFASAPFLFFVDHKPELFTAVQQGRDGFLSQFETARHALEAEGVKVPIDERAFQTSKLDWTEATKHAPVLALHRDLLRLRREDPLLAAQDLTRIAGATLGADALVLRWSGDPSEGGDRLLLLNLGADLSFDPCPEPLLAPVPGTRWRMKLSSQEARYGGAGARAPTGEGPWSIPGQCALVLTSEERGDDERT